mgnify:CR=1 FL=1
MTDPLPELNYGFKMAVQSRQSSVGFSDKPNIEDLPPDFRDIADPQADVAPHVSQFVIRVRPDRPVHLRYFQTFGLAEEMMHGRRHQFGLTRSHHLLRMRSIRTLFDIINGRISLKDGAEKIIEAENAIQELYGKRLEYLEGIDKYLCQSVMSEEGYLDRHVEEYLSLDTDIDAKTVRQRFEQLREFLDGLAREESQTVYDELSALEADYGRRVTEVVADAALDTPYLVGPHTIEGIEAIPVSELDLQSRFDAAINAVRSIDPSEIEEDREELLADIGSELSDPLVGTESTHPRELHLPLLDIPQSIDTSEALKDKYDVILEAPSAIGQILNAAFRFTGNFGGVIYRMEKPEGLETDLSDDLVANWQVNPLVADNDVQDDALGVPVESVDSYKELWEWVYFGHHMLDSIMARTHQHTLGDIHCPLCGVSVTGECHPDGCRCQTLVKAIEDDLKDMVNALEKADSGAF